MKNKYILAFFLILPFFFLGGMTFHAHKNLNSGKEVIIRMSGFDPFNILSGHYLDLRTDFSNTDCSQFKDNKCPTHKFNYRYKYYLPEFDAKAIDTLIMTLNPQINLVFIYNDSTKPHVKNLLIDNMEWKDWLEKIKQSSEQPAAQQKIN